MRECVLRRRKRIKKGRAARERAVAFENKLINTRRAIKLAYCTRRYLRPAVIMTARVLLVFSVLARRLRHSREITRNSMPRSGRGRRRGAGPEAHTHTPHIHTRRTALITQFSPKSANNGTHCERSSPDISFSRARLERFRSSISTRRAKKYTRLAFDYVIVALRSSREGRKAASRTGRAASTRSRGNQFRARDADQRLSR